MCDDLSVIKNLKNLLNASDELLEFSDILSGSLFYIFGLFNEGKSLSCRWDETLLAKERGFTEPNPYDDLFGIDVTRKLLILVREAGYCLEVSDIEIEPILLISFEVSGVTLTIFQRLTQLDQKFKISVLKVAAAQQEKSFLISG
ncbi:MAG: hypothetical protein ACTS73_07730 [Arsenophonus sp. NEOnobi-MAG3]